MRNGFIFMLFCLFAQLCSAQKMNALTSYRNINSTHYFRLYYDNDIFFATDANYTQGIRLELVAPFLSKNPLNYLFYHPKNAKIRYGLSVEHICYTPVNYDLPSIQFGDRPFAAAIVAKSFMIATNTKRKSRFTSSFAIGVIGPAALGEEMQAGIHKATGSKTPLGWSNQIKNDVVLNYTIGYEKQLVKYRHLFSLQANADGQVGTLFTNVSIGVTTTFGIINAPFSSSTKIDNFNLYLYAQPLINGIGYDATLQGGLLNRKSSYTISSSKIKRFTGQLNYGVVLKIKPIYLEISGTFISKEFETGKTANWGGIRLGVLF